MSVEATGRLSRAQRLAAEPPPQGGTLAGLLVGAAAEHGDADVLVYADRRLSYADLLAAARRRARDLLRLGVCPGDRVGILLHDGPEYVEVLFGCALVDAVAVPINVRFRSREVGHVLRAAGVRVLVTTDSASSHTDFVALLHATLPDLAAAEAPFPLALDSAPELRAITGIAPGAARPLVDAGTLERDDVVELRDPTRGEDDVALMMFTSGTTANPKGCMLGNGAVVRNAHGFAALFGLGPEDRVWDPLPFFHMASLIPLTAAMTVGAAYLGMRHFEAGEALAMIAEERATVVYPLFPAITQDLIHHPGAAALHADRIRLVCNVAPPDVQRAVQAAFAPARLVNAYGITEGTGTVVYSHPDDTDDERAHTCGYPFPGVEAAVVDAQTGAPLRQGERGELVIRGYLVFHGYFGDPQNTSAVLDADGWLHTGDVCSLDAEGRVIYHGRTKDMFKVGGENVGALEVESVLSLHPAVKLAQVVGIPDARLGEVPAAFVELAPGGEATELELRVFCEQRIARFKAPRHVRFVDEWPMSATKVQKFRLRSALIEELGLERDG